jgi:peroxiredoxin
MKKYFFLTFLFCLSITISCQNNINRGYRVSVGDPSPEINLSLLDGTEITNENLKGKVVVIQFTASWCSVCIKEMPHLEKEVWQRFKGDDFILIGVDLKEELAVVEEFIKKTQVSYPFTIDADGSFFESFTLPKAGVTRNIVLDKNGDISFLTRLYDEQEFSEMVSHIDILLK